MRVKIIATIILVLAVSMWLLISPNSPNVDGMIKGPGVATDESIDDMADGSVHGDADGSIDESSEVQTSGGLKNQCADGEAPLSLSGTCDGSWKVRKTEEEVFCDFVWGPKIVCPSGKTSLTIAAACYGTTSKPLSTDQKAKSSEDCEELFGERPSKIDYNISCCDS